MFTSLKALRKKQQADLFAIYKDRKNTEKTGQDMTSDNMSPGCHTDRFSSSYASSSEGEAIITQAIPAKKKKLHKSQNIIAVKNENNGVSRLNESIKSTESQEESHINNRGFEEECVVRDKYMYRDSTLMDKGDFHKSHKKKKKKHKEKEKNPDMMTEKNERELTHDICESVLSAKKHKKKKKRKISEPAETDLSITSTCEGGISLNKDTLIPADKVLKKQMKRKRRLELGSSDSEHESPKAQKKKKKKKKKRQKREDSHDIDGGCVDSGDGPTVSLKDSTAGGEQSSVLSNFFSFSDSSFGNTSTLNSSTITSGHFSQSSVQRKSDTKNSTSTSSLTLTPTKHSEGKTNGGLFKNMDDSKLNKQEKHSDSSMSDNSGVEDMIDSETLNISGPDSSQVHKKTMRVETNDTDCESTSSESVKRTEKEDSPGRRENSEKQKSSKSKHGERKNNIPETKRKSESPRKLTPKKRESSIGTKTPVRITEDGETTKMGKWSMAEGKQLKENLDKFIEKHPDFAPSELLSGFRWNLDGKHEIEQFKKQTDFYRCLSEGLNRSKKDIYWKAKAFCTPEVRGRFSAEESRRLRELVLNYGKDFAHIAAVMGRTSKSVQHHWQNISKKRDTVTGSFSAQEDDILKSAVLEQLKEKGEDYSNISWNLVASNMKRTPRQCRQRWMTKLCLKQSGNDLPEPKFGPAEKIALIEALYNSGYTEESEIDWHEIAKDFTHVATATCLQIKWGTLKKCCPKMEFQELLEYMVIKEIPSYQEMIDTGRKRKQ